MYKRFSSSNAVLLGMLFAMVGFSFALATGSSMGNGDAVGARAVGATLGSALAFTNQFATTAPTTDRDLGDVALGSSFVRYATATGGIRPYTFAQSNAIPTLTSVLTGNTAKISVFASGQVAGSMGNIALINSPIRFTIMVTDSLGTQPDRVTNVFRLTLVSNSVFKFAVGPQLQGGVQYQPYFASLAVNNGVAKYTFAVSSVTLNGSATTLAAQGLSLDASAGIIYGKPLVPGTIAFTANCTDSKGSVALSRSGFGAGQAMSIVVSANNILVSDIVATSISIKAGSIGKDSVSFAGIANLAGNSASSFVNATVVLKIGGYTSPTGLLNAGKITTDTTGAVVSKAKGATKPAAGPAISGSLNSSGQLKISIKNETIDNLLTGSALTSGNQGLAVLVQITPATPGFALSSSEFLSFVVKASSKGSTLTYKANGTGDLAGDFILTSAQGKDASSKATNTNADAWKVGFIALPPGNETYGGPTQATIGIGAGFSSTLGVTASNGSVKLAVKPAKADNTITSLSMSAKTGKSSLSTSNLDASKTNITTAAKAPNPGTSIFALGLTLSSSAGTLGAGSGSIAITAAKTSGNAVQPGRTMQD